jgi:hypothetical protein
MNFFCILLISVDKFECVSELFHSQRNFCKKLKTFTNTFKLTHRNEQNTSKIWYLNGKEFHAPHALSLHIFIYDFDKRFSQLAQYYYKSWHYNKFPSSRDTHYLDTKSKGLG